MLARRTTSKSPGEALPDAPSPAIRIKTAAVSINDFGETALEVFTVDPDTKLADIRGYYWRDGLLIDLGMVPGLFAEMRPGVSNPAGFWHSADTWQRADRHSIDMQVA